MLNAYQLRLKYKNKYRLKVASFFLDTLYVYFFSDFLRFDMSLLLLTVTLRGVSNKHCLLPLISFYSKPRLWALFRNASLRIASLRWL